MSRELQIVNEVMDTEFGAEDLLGLYTDEYTDEIERLKDVQRTLRRDYKIQVLLKECVGILRLYALNYYYQ